MRASSVVNCHDTVSTVTNKMAMVQFAKNFAPDVIVLEPKELREAVKESLKRSLEYYRERNPSSWQRVPNGRKYFF